MLNTFFQEGEQFCRGGFAPPWLRAHSGPWRTFRKTISVIVVSSQYQTTLRWNTAVWTTDNLIAFTNKLSSLIKMTKRHAHVVAYIWLYTQTWWETPFGGGPWARADLSLKPTKLRAQITISSERLQIYCRQWPTETCYLGDGCWKKGDKNW